MKLILFTPINRASAIARVSSLIAARLSTLGISYAVVATESHVVDKDSRYPFAKDALHWTDTKFTLSSISGATPIYQIGDHFDYHEGALHWLESHPGLVILHDTYLGHLFRGWAVKHKTEAFRLRSKLNMTEASLDVFVDGVVNPDFMQYGHKYSLLACESASGVLCHSAWSAEFANQLIDFPARVAHLPWYEIPLEIQQEANSLKSSFQVLTFGNINPNKRCLSVIEALSELDSGTKQVEYRIAGAISKTHEHELKAAAKKRSVNIQLLGRLADEDLELEISSANVVTNLRFPTLEGASASLLDAFGKAKPVIVTDAGHFREIPEGIVIKINQLDEISELRGALSELINNPELGQRLGEKAREYFLDHHGIDPYVAELLSAVEDSDTRRALVLQRNRARNLNIEFIGSMLTLDEKHMKKIQRRGALSYRLNKTVAPILRWLAARPLVVRGVKKAYKAFPALENFIHKALRLLAS